MMSCDRPSAVLIVVGLLIFTHVVRWTQSVHAYQEAGVLIDDPRPVAKAMALLSRQLRWTITYEDPLYVNAAELRFFDQRHAIPRGGRLQLPANPIESAQRDPVAFLESVVSREETAYGRVKRFKVLRSKSMFHVVPEQVLDASGKWQTSVPILDTWIPMSHDIVTLSQFLERVCEELSAVSATKVITATVPRGPLADMTLAPQNRMAQARTLLIDALSTMPVQLKWVLMYDPSSATYYLSVLRPF